jgi:hypothetical protein
MVALAAHTMRQLTVSHLHCSRDCCCTCIATARWCKVCHCATPLLAGQHHPSSHPALAATAVSYSVWLVPNFPQCLEPSHLSVHNTTPKAVSPQTPQCSLTLQTAFGPAANLSIPRQKITSPGLSCSQRLAKCSQHSHSPIAAICAAAASHSPSHSASTETHAVITDHD